VVAAGRKRKKMVDASVLRWRYRTVAAVDLTCPVDAVVRETCLAGIDV
jgi:hypothetical protein